MRCTRIGILAIPFFLSVHICLTMEETQSISYEEFNAQIAKKKELQEQKEQRRKAIKYCLIGCCIPCFWFKSCYHCHKACKD